MKVNRSSYYHWVKNHMVSYDDLLLQSEMKRKFNCSRKSLGSRRMSHVMREMGFSVGRYKARRLMRHLNLVVCRKRQYKVTTDSKHTLPVAQNILNRDFTPEKVNESWGADITYLQTHEGWLYLAVVIDLYSRRVVGWCIDKRMDKSLVIRALSMAITLRQPKAGLIHHSDRGGQYASHEYQELLEQHGIVPSMSRKGNCWDNAPVERFFGSLKREWVGGSIYHTRKDAVADITEYVAVYYNTIRLHSTLGYMTPVNFEKAA